MVDAEVQFCYAWQKVVLCLGQFAVLHYRVDDCIVHMPIDQSNNVAVHHTSIWAHIKVLIQRLPLLDEKLSTSVLYFSAAPFPTLESSWIIKLQFMSSGESRKGSTESTMFHRQQ